MGELSPFHADVYSRLSLIARRDKRRSGGLPPSGKRLSAIHHIVVDDDRGTHLTSLGDSSDQANADADNVEDNSHSNLGRKKKRFLKRKVLNRTSVNNSGAS